MAQKTYVIGFSEFMLTVGKMTAQSFLAMAIVLFIMVAKLSFVQTSKFL